MVPPIVGALGHILVHPRLSRTRPVSQDPCTSAIVPCLHPPHSRCATKTPRYVRPILPIHQLLGYRNNKSHTPTLPRPRNSASCTIRMSNTICKTRSLRTSGAAWIWLRKSWNELSAMRCRIPGQNAISHKFGATGRTRAMRQHKPRQTRPFSRNASSLRFTDGTISSPRIPSRVEFSSNVCRCNHVHISVYSPWDMKGDLPRSLAPASRCITTNTADQPHPTVLVLLG